jgi:4-amino-4-deoxy-L-arabinose transferase-like glycosyltransferase
MLGCVYSIVTPLMEASDELWHYPMVRYLANHRALPVQEAGLETAWRQEGSQPPLYYALGAVLTGWIDTSDLGKIRRLNPHADNGKITEDGNTNLIVHVPAGIDKAWRGTTLAIHLIRFLSVLMGAGTVYLGYRLLLEIWPDRWEVALAAAALTAFNPMFLFISGAVNNDNLAMMLCALGIWLLVRLVRRHGAAAPKVLASAWWRDLVLLGIVLGLAVLTKTSAMGLLPLTALAVSFVAWKQRSWQRFLTGGAVTAGLVALIAGWWFVRNAILYDGDWFGLERFILVLGYRVPPATLRQLWSERAGFMMAYWGLFGGVNLPMPGWVYSVLNAALILAGTGLLIGGVRLAWGATRAPGEVGSLQTRHVQVLLLALWPLVVFISWAGWATKTWSSQGRLVFSAITAWSAWMAVGLGQLWPRRASHRQSLSSVAWAGLLALFLLGLSMWVPFGVIAPAYRAPVLAAEAALVPEHVLRADVGGQVRLLGYDLEQVGDSGSLGVQPGEALRLSLYWESLAPMDRDWSIFFHVLDADLELVLATRDRYPGQGLLATSAMTPGLRWVDKYVVWLPETTFAPSRAQLEVGLYDLATGERPPIRLEEGPSTGSGQAPSASSGQSQAKVIENALRFQPFDVKPRPADIPNPMFYQMENKMALVGWDVEPRVVAAGETLYLTLYWEGLAPMAGDYQVSTQVVRADQLKAAQVDAAPGGVVTSRWAKGQRVEDRRELVIDPNAPPGGYDILVSVYEWETVGTIRRLRLIDDEGYVLPGDSLTLGQVRVVPSLRSGRTP